ncbi:hypothetical protein [Bradyrhizobium sp. LHD-71]|uniref:hypothetical protein n=1 Tax=Bradyrhizobium sp. LHD-71 TaxID=3072141 RepID=UPI00280C4552|nr:hypothetical protein [Bradyrhizobium sp. LHD-71]MDQ8728426.1 hypothetical protein [Bradyrhizobium sp. LHD-71]
MTADAAKRLLEIAKVIGPDPQGRIFVERVHAVFRNEGGQAYDYRAGIGRLKRDGLIDMHDSGTFFRMSPDGSAEVAKS